MPKKTFQGGKEYRPFFRSKFTTYHKLFRQSLHNPGSAWSKRRTLGQAQRARRQQSGKKWWRRCSPSTCCPPPRTVHLWQRTSWAITQLPPASWPGPSFAPLLSGALCPVPTWGGVRLSSTWMLRWGWISSVFVRMRTRMMMMIDPSEPVNHLRWRAQQSLPQEQATIGVFFSNECRSGSSREL